MDPNQIAMGGPANMGSAIHGGVMGVGGIMPGYDQGFIPQQIAAPMPVPSVQPPATAAPTLPPGITMAPPQMMPPLEFTQPAPPPGAGQEGSYDWNAIEETIKEIEGGKPTSRGPRITNRNSAYYGDQAEGAFGQMGNDVAEWTRRATGRAMTREEFRASPEAQRAVFRAHFGSLLQRFGNPVDAAQAYFAGPDSVGRPGALDRTDAQQGFPGTSVRDYRRLFASIYSRRASGQPVVDNGFAPQSMEVSPEMADILGAASTTVPAPGSLSPRGAAMAPGLAAASAPQVGPATGPSFQPQAPANPQTAAGFNPGVAAAMPFGDLWQNTLRTPSSGLTQLASLQAQMEPGEQIAAAQIFQRGQQIQAENPGITPQQTAQMLVRDPAFARNAIFLGQKGLAVLSAASQPAIQPTFQALSPGQQMFAQQGGQVTPVPGAYVPPNVPAEMQIIRALESMDPQARASFLSAFSQWRDAMSRPSDREQAVARIRQAEAAGQEPDQHDLQIAGYNRVVPRFGPTGNVVGEDVISTYRRGAPVPSMPDQRYPGSTPPTVAPGGAAGVPAGAPVPPPAGAPGTPTSQAPPQPRVIGRRPDGRDVVDVPEISLNTSLLNDPAEMAIAGPVQTARGLWGRVVGNLFPATEEQILARQSLLDQFRAQYATYIKGTRLAGEHATAMAAVPDSNAILTNPLRSVNQMIGVREGLINELRLATEQAADQQRDPATRRQADGRIIEIQNLLRSMPSMEGMYNLASRLRVGERIAGTDPSEVTDLARQAPGVLQGRAPGSTPPAGETPRVIGEEPSALPPDLTKLGIPELQRLSQRSNLTTADRQRLIQALRDRLPTSPEGRPPVPRSY